MCAEASTTRYVQAADAGSVVDSQTTAGLRNQLNGMVGLGGATTRATGVRVVSEECVGVAV